MCLAPRGTRLSLRRVWLGCRAASWAGRRFERWDRLRVSSASAHRGWGIRAGADSQGKQGWSAAEAEKARVLDASGSPTAAARAACLPLPVASVEPVLSRSWLMMSPPPEV